jgi:hypothetical protein
MVPAKSQNADCRVCNRRRVKCDRRVPGCCKCEKRGLECSGYELILKWDQGVASRGNLKGKDLPIASRRDLSARSDLTHHGGSEADDRGRFLEFKSNSSLQVYDLPPALKIYHLNVADHRRLLYHYDNIVAANMAWSGE